MMTLKRILVATDFGEAADVALTYGRELARTFGATLDVLHVADNFFARGYAGEGYIAAYPQMQSDVEDAAARSLAALLSDEDRAVLGAKPIVRTSASPALTIVDYARDTQHRSHCDGHARARRDGPSADGQRRRTGRPHGAVSGADGTASGTRVRPA